MALFVQIHWSMIIIKYIYIAVGTWPLRMPNTVLKRFTIVVEIAVNAQAANDYEITYILIFTPQKNFVYYTLQRNSHLWCG